MYLLKYLFIVSNILLTKSLLHINNFQKNNFQKNNILINKKSKFSLNCQYYFSSSTTLNIYNSILDIKPKTKSFLKLIRYKNIVPTIFLSFTGGYIINPSLSYLVKSPQFIASTLITTLIMALSMIFNDIFDIEIDKINNNNRPIVTGEITKKIASIYAAILFTLIQILNINFLPVSLQQITNFIIFITFIYTPILKKIPFIKNISCALLVSFSVIFNGLSTIYKNTNINHKNTILLLISTKLIFFGSLYNELLLDMSDIKGDRENNIYTIPVIFGNKISWNFAYYILIFNFLINSIFINYLYNYFSGIILLFICSILVNDLYNIKLNNYSKNIIKDTVNNTTKPLFYLLLYLCILAREKI